MLKARQCGNEDNCFSRHAMHILMLPSHYFQEKYILNAALYKYKMSFTYSHLYLV